MSGFSIEKKMDVIDVARMLADERVRKELNCILVELARAEQLHPVWPEDEASGLGIIDAQFEAVSWANSGSDRQRHKLHATAAMCIRQLINTEWKK